MKTYLLFVLGVGAGLFAISMVLIERRSRERAFADIQADLARDRQRADQSSSAWIPLIRRLSAQPAPIPIPVATPIDLRLQKAVPPAKAPLAEVADVRERYGDVFASDNPDPAWAEAVTGPINEKLVAALPAGSSIRSLECRSSMCRLILDHKDRQTYWQFLRTSLVDPSGKFWNGAVAAFPLAEDPNDGAMVAYLVREGRSPPELPQ